MAGSETQTTNDIKKEVCELRGLLDRQYDELCGLRDRLKRQFNEWCDQLDRQSDELIELRERQYVVLLERQSDLAS